MPQENHFLALASAEVGFADNQDDPTNRAGERDASELQPFARFATTAVYHLAVDGGALSPLSFGSYKSTYCAPGPSSSGGVGLQPNQDDLDYTDA